MEQQAERFRLPFFKRRTTMAQNDEQTRILQMVADGKIKPEEAAMLLEALSTRGAGDQTQPAEEASTKQGRWLRIKVEEGGSQRVNIRLPLRMVDVGMRIAGRFVPELNVQNVGGSLSEALRSGEVGKIIEVHDDEDDEHVEIWLE